MSISPIETLYRGHRFRSRLEARWAVFFDTAGIPYKYEDEGYDVDGTWYLPDFWLPNQGCWIEIKGPEPTAEQLGVMESLVRGTGARGYFVSGSIPFPFPLEGWIRGYDWGQSGRDFREVHSASWAQCLCCLKVDITDNVNDWPGLKGGSPGCGCMGALMAQTQELILGDGTEQALFEADKDRQEALVEAIKRLFKPEPWFHTSETPLLRDAYYAARQARFDRRDPPLTPQEKALRLRTEWDRILMDLSLNDENSAATFFGWLEVVSFTGNTLNLAVAKESSTLIANKWEARMVRELAQQEAILKPFYEAVRNRSGIEIDKISLSTRSQGS